MCLCLCLCLCPYALCACIAPDVLCHTAIVTSLRGGQMTDREFSTKTSHKILQLEGVGPGGCFRPPAQATYLQPESEISQWSSWSSSLVVLISPPYALRSISCQAPELVLTHEQQDMRSCRVSTAPSPVLRS